MKYKFKILNSIWFILILIVNQNLSASEKFTPFSEISQNTRLISIERVVVHGGEIGSPLYGEIPDSLSVSKYDRRSHEDSTVIIQSIKTNQQGYYSLAGDIPGGIFFYIIFGGIGGIIGGNIARYFKWSMPFWSVVGGIGCVVLGAVLFETPVVTLIVDNASDESIILEIDSLSPTTISARSQAKVKFIKGVKNIRTVNASDKSEIEHFDLQVTDEDKYYIYNVAGLNEYTSHQAAYIEKR